MSAPGRQGERGFTLFELLVVLAVLGLIGGLVWPALERAVRGQQFRAATVAALSALREARARAVATGSTVAVAAGSDGSRLLVGGRLAEPMPVPVRVSPAGGILFFGDGTASGGALELDGGGRHARLVVAPATALVRSAG